MSLLTRILLMIALALLLAVCCSPAHAYTFRIVDPNHRFTPTTTARIQRALSFQVNRQLARFWNVTPVNFASDGIPVVLSPQAQMPDGDTLGYHLPDQIVVDAAWPTGVVEVTISHEVLETEVDRDGTGYEVCDPVNSYSYRGVGGVWLSDFMVNNHAGFLKGDYPQ